MEDMTHNSPTSDYNLYVIELENKKIFLHVSMPIYDEYLFQECIILFDFVKKNRPIKVNKVISLKDSLEVDYYVKYYMRHYGIENVRGGNFSQEILNKDTLQILEREIFTGFDNYESQNDIIEEIIQNNKISPLNDKFIEDLRDSNKYIHNRKKLVAILYDVDDYNEIDNIQIFQNIIKDIDWLIETINEKRGLYTDYYNANKNQNKNYSSLKENPNFISTDEKQRYKNILIKLNFLRRVYFGINEDNLNEYLDPYLRTKISGFKIYQEDTFEYVHIKKPEFLLDNLFLHPRLIVDWDKFSNYSCELLDEFSYMAYSLHNFTSELLYDIDRHRPDFEKRVKCTMDYYELFCKNLHQCY